MSDASQVGLYYAKELSLGAGPPAATAFKTVRFTSESLKQQMTFEESDEISPDRATTGVVRTSIGASGAINFEFSYSTYDDFLAAALCSVWTGDVLQNGALKSSYVLEKNFSDITEYLNYVGMSVDTFTLEIPAQGKITGSFGFIGLNEDATGATIAAIPTPIAASITPIVNSVDNVSNILEGGTAFTGCVDRISLSGNNNLRTRHCVGSATATGIGLGKLQITGTFRAHYTSRALYEKKLDQTVSSLGWTITDNLGNAYVFLLPEIKYTDGQVVTGGNNQDVIADLSFTCMQDPVIAAMIRITRVPFGSSSPVPFLIDESAILISRSDILISDTTYTP